MTAVPANIARALIGGLKHDLPADDAPLRRLVPQKLLGFRDSLLAALEQLQDAAFAGKRKITVPLAREVLGELLGDRHGERPGQRPDEHGRSE